MLQMGGFRGVPPFHIPHYASIKAIQPKDRMIYMICKVIFASWRTVLVPRKAQSKVDFGGEIDFLRVHVIDDILQKLFQYPPLFWNDYLRQ